MQLSFKKSSHPAALLYGLILIVIIVIAFSSFALGAYMVFNKPVSNVIADTAHSSTGQYVVQVYATGLSNNSQRIVWIDPSVTTDPNGNQFVDANSGFRIGNGTSDSDGVLWGNFSLSNAIMYSITNDGVGVHSVWIVGIVSSQSTTQSLALTPDSEKNYSSATTGSQITFFVTLLTFELPINFNLGSLFIILWTLYLFLFATALNGPIKNVISALIETTRKGLDGIFNNSMLGMVAVFPVVLWGTILLAFLQQAGGVQTGSLPNLDPLLLYVELSLAPLREEIGFRVIPIGIAALLILLARGKVRDGILALWHPSRYLKKNDTKEEYKRHLLIMYIMIGISSFLFGLAHYVLGAGWGPGKIAEAAVAGIALSALYYLYGFPAAVLLHWSIDYFLTTFDLTSSLSPVYVFLTLYTMGLAAISSAVFIILLVRRFRKHPSTVF